MIDTRIATKGSVRTTGRKGADFGIAFVALQEWTLRAFPIARIRGWRIGRRDGTGECGGDAEGEQCATMARGYLHLDLATA
jgi:hypothetical protein